MTSKKLNPITNLYPRNFGAYAESVVAYDVTGEIRTHDHVPFDKGSDIPELNASVKSARFTLASANLSNGNTLEEKINDYFNRVASNLFIYVTKDLTAYYMDANEFRAFLEKFTTLQRESEKNGNGMKVRAKSESKAMKQWLAIRAAV